MIFLAFLPGLEIREKSTLQKFDGCKMAKIGPKTLSNHKDSPHTEQ